jgi:hypothetical protein
MKHDMTYRKLPLTGLQAACVFSAALMVSACNRNADTPETPTPPTPATPESSVTPGAGDTPQAPMTPVTPDAGSAPGAQAPSSSPDMGAGSTGSAGTSASSASSSIGPLSERLERAPREASTAGFIRVVATSDKSATTSKSDPRESRYALSA